MKKIITIVLLLPVWLWGQNKPNAAKKNHPFDVSTAIPYQYLDTATENLLLRQQGIEFVERQGRQVWLGLNHFELDHINPNIKIRKLQNPTTKKYWCESVEFYQNDAFCSEFNVRENNPYLFEGVLYDSLVQQPLPRKELIRLFRLENTPIPIPDDFVFGKINSRFGATPYINGLTVVGYWLTITNCTRPEQYSCGNALMLQHYTYYVLDECGNIIWQLLHDHPGGELLLTDNGKYVCINYGGIAEDYAIDYLWPTGIKIYDIEKNQLLYYEDLNQASSISISGNDFSYEKIDNSQNTRTTYKIRPKDKIIYSLTHQMWCDIIGFSYKNESSSKKQCT
ncbi:MAG: hypothetical protein H6554_00960 [Chitinophagales bacterium]|nr:hypothetical protein [Chitinophagales bacterium]